MQFPPTAIGKIGPLQPQERVQSREQREEKTQKKAVERTRNLAVALAIKFHHFRLSRQHLTLQFATAMHPPIIPLPTQL
jgi:hypothetical protein